MMVHRRLRTIAQQTGRSTDDRRSGFTLVELLVVIFIILLVSAVTLPTIVSAISHRQVSEAARVLQAALVGARDSAIHNNAISGIRLLPDPTINGINTNPSSPLYGLLDPSLPLAMSRIVPLEAAPDYDEGKVSIIQDLAAYSPFPMTTTWGFPYPYPATGAVNVLMVEECPLDPKTFTPNEPTSWFWNIRIGDKIRIGNAGQYYTVIGPMAQDSPELFVNDGAPGAPPWLQRAYANPSNAGPFYVEYLFLVNGQDDDKDGFVDNGWDGVDNDQDGNVDIVSGKPSSFNEWTEPEKWLGSLAGTLPAVNGLPSPQVTFPPMTPLTPGLLNQSYTITRRPAPSSGSREVALPSNVVIDLTTWAATAPNVPERSRFPVPANGIGTSQVVNPNSGSVDIVVNPDGSIVPSTVYSSPSSFGLNGAFLHFWLAERSDVVAPDITGTYSLLPLPAGLAPTNFASGAELKGEYSLVTVYSRTGQIIVTSPPRFDVPSSSGYNKNIPFVEAQQGVTGGNR